MKDILLNIIDNIDKLSTLRQIGGIEVSVLENGPERGVRTVHFITGSGLNFRVVPDRGLAIADAFYKQYSLAWISHKGITAGNNTSTPDWLSGFGGGLMTTCGLTHTGPPENDSYGKRGLHDTISYTPAHIESIVQPNLYDRTLEMSITGSMIQSTVFGPSLELKRTISAELGKAKLKIHDRVRNLGNQPAPHMLLYHINMGWPLIDKGTQLVWQGKWNLRSPDGANFSEQDLKTCKAPTDEHCGKGETVVCIDIDADQKGLCRCEAYNPRLGFGLRITFRKDQLPWLTNWQHWGKNEYVTALEPGTNPPVGQSVARKEGTLIELQPHEVREYDLEIEII